MDKFKGKKVLILGLGTNQGGVGAARFFAKQGSQVRVTDLKTERELKGSLEELEQFEDITYVLGEHRLADIDWADIVIRNPALKPGNEFREYAQRSGKRVELDMGILLDFVKPGQIIGITGTKGKSTTSSLIYEVLLRESKSQRVKESKVEDSPHPSLLPEGEGTISQEQSDTRTLPRPLGEGRGEGWDVLFAGNIGKSVLDTVEHLTEETILVLELSSFQLEAFREHQVSPHWAVITNVFEDHLNYYTNMDEYTDAKRIIAEFQTSGDFLYLWKDDQVTNRPEFLKDLKGQIIRFGAEDLPKDYKTILKGPHNLPNLAAALKVAESFGIDQSKALSVMAQFRGVPFRQELVYNKDQIKIYNDTTATTPIAAVQALKTFNNCLLIVGGMNKNVSYKELAEAIDRHAKAVYFLAGDATDELKTMIQHRNIGRSTYTDLELLLKDVRVEAKKGDTILFSPGATSFNLFQNEFDRGRKFNAAVEKIFNR